MNVDNLMFMVAVVGIIAITLYIFLSLLRGKKAGRKQSLSNWWKKIWDLFWGM